MPVPAIRDPLLIEYLEEMLARARRGEVLFFAGAASTIEGGELQVRLGVAMSRQVEVLDTASLQNGFARTAEGVAYAVKALSDGVDLEVSQRGSMS